MSYLSTHKDGRVLLRVYVQPKASRNGFAGLHKDAIKLAITAPPVDGKANTAVVKFLAAFLNVKKNNLEIRYGLQSRNKTICISGLGEEAIRDRMQAVSV